MSVINALAAQRIKADFAQHLASYLVANQDISALFVGATSLTTVTNLIAAMSYRALDGESDWRFECDANTELADEVVMSVLLDAFRLLFVKASQQNLSQPEQLIVNIAIKLAKQWQAQGLAPEQQALASSLSVILHLAEVLAQGQQVRRQQSRNMGR
ncbi:hypothetical protein FJQ87_02865 [Shewanella sp. SNU WT4]|uniref:hypothetical protein n=1 Tax=Shewanella sp. SNU WT4 TaxID=2590015 RepID=UPI001126942F|nr:hypothetical protein [Shewanella sp. SNU WT4]QDF65755.1 hypothetical protein FJQ87_02865 [Shewanella sp. SNU WT4]